MAIQFTEIRIPTSTGYANVKIGIDPNNPSSVPKIYTRDSTNAGVPTVLYEWNPTSQNFTFSGSANDLLPSGKGFSSTETYGSLLTQNENVFKANTTTVINKLPDSQKQGFQDANTYQPYTTFAQNKQAAAAAAAQRNAATAATDDITRAGAFAANTGVNISLGINSADYRKEYAKGYPNNEYYYPIDLASNKQDRIKFTMKSNEGSTINTKFGAVDPFKRKEGTTITGSVTLPIQPSISDSNTVDWSGGSLNPVAAAAAGAALQLIRSDNAFQLNQNAAAILAGVMKALRSTDAQNAMNVYFAQEAVGIQGLLSRTTGAVLNPNLELLFGGPTLRSFGFTFRLSPRELKEANAVREIIRFFKQGMAVKKGKSSAFLKSPNIFDIKYLAYDNNGALIEHPSINRIKTCALIGCDVDYTPDGTYMTFVDGSRTMTSYQLTLRFSELDPIYESDYGDNSPIPNSHIGY